jgi:VanZ family protein
MRLNIPKLFFFFPSLFYYALIFFFSSKSYPVEADVFLFDKMIHFIEFGVLGFLLSLGFFVFKDSFKSNFFLVFSIGSILAVLDEIHQFFIPLRTLEVFDMAADILGVGVGFFIFAYFYKKNN